MVNLNEEVLAQARIKRHYEQAAQDWWNEKVKTNDLLNSLLDRFGIEPDDQEDAS